MAMLMLAFGMMAGHILFVLSVASQSTYKVKLAMPNMRWFLLDTTHPGYTASIVDCGNRHKRNWPRNILSIVLSDDGTRALVKSDSMGAAHRRGRWSERVRGGGIMRDIYDRSERHRARALIRTPAWSNTQKFEI